MHLAILHAIERVDPGFKKDCPWSVWVEGLGWVRAPKHQLLNNGSPAVLVCVGLVFRFEGPLAVSRER